VAKFAAYYTNEDSKDMGDCEELQKNIEKLSGWVTKRQENFRIKICKIIHIRQSSLKFTRTIIDSDLFTTNLERHLGIITNRSVQTLAQHSVRI